MTDPDLLKMRIKNSAPKSTGPLKWARKEGETPEEKPALAPSTPAKDPSDVETETMPARPSRRLANEHVDDEETQRPLPKPAKKKSHVCQTCQRSFARPCDLSAHSKSHNRSWKCPITNCKYHQYGWPTENKLNRHINDKHSADPLMYECFYKPCLYKSKRESHVKQHMEMVHGWTYVRTKTIGKAEAFAGPSGISQDKPKAGEPPRGFSMSIWKSVGLPELDDMNTATTKGNKEAGDQQDSDAITETGDKLLEAAYNLYHATPETQKTLIREAVQAKLSPAQLGEYRATGQDPAMLYFRNQSFFHELNRMMNRPGRIPEGPTEDNLGSYAPGNHGLDGHQLGNIKPVTPGAETIPGGSGYGSTGRLPRGETDSIYGDNLPDSTHKEVPAQGLGVHHDSSAPQAANVQIAPTDSGYASLGRSNEKGEKANPSEIAATPMNDAEDTTTIYSVAQSVAEDDAEMYISQFAEALADYVSSESRTDVEDPRFVQKLVDNMPSLLRAFALRLGCAGSSMPEREVMYFIHKQRG